jgi:hypothetical protein
MGKKFFSCNFFLQFLVIKALDPDWIRIRIGLQAQPLDPGDSVSTDPKRSQPVTVPKCYFGYLIDPLITVL